MFDTLFAQKYGYKLDCSKTLVQSLINFNRADSQARAVRRRGF